MAGLVLDTCKDISCLPCLLLPQSQQVKHWAGQMMVWGEKEGGLYPLWKGWRPRRKVWTFLSLPLLFDCFAWGHFFSPFPFAVPVANPELARSCPRMNSRQHRATCFSQALQGTVGLPSSVMLLCNWRAGKRLGWFPSGCAGERTLLAATSALLDRGALPQPSSLCFSLQWSLLPDFIPLCAGEDECVPRGQGMENPCSGQWGCLMFDGRWTTLLDCKQKNVLNLLVSH